MVRQLRRELSEPAAIPTGYEPAQARFEAAHSRLDPETAFVFRQASAGEGLAIAVSATSAALNLPEHAIRALLNTLADVHLVEADNVSGEFCYDPMIKKYAQRKAAAVDGPARGPGAAA